MNAEEFAAVKKRTDEALLVLEKEGQRLHEQLAVVQQGLSELTERRFEVKSELRKATAAFQMTRLGIAAPNVVNVPTATVKVKGN